MHYRFHLQPFHPFHPFHPSIHPSTHPSIPLIPIHPFFPPPPFHPFILSIHPPFHTSLTYIHIHLPPKYPFQSPPCPPFSTPSKITSPLPRLPLSFCFPPQKSSVLPAKKREREGGREVQYPRPILSSINLFIHSFVRSSVHLYIYTIVYQSTNQSTLFTPSSIHRSIIHPIHQ